MGKLSLANNMVHVEGTNWHIKSKYDNSFGEVRNWHNHYGLGNADMNLFLGEYQRGMSGVAYLGTACRSTCCNNALVMNKKDKTTTAVTLAHEIGHLIGMNHDHADAHKKLDATRLRIKDSWLMENINSNGLHVADPILKP